MREHVDLKKWRSNKRSSLEIAMNIVPISRRVQLFLIFLCLTRSQPMFI